MLVGVICDITIMMTLLREGRGYCKVSGEENSKWLVCKGVAWSSLNIRLEGLAYSIVGILMSPNGIIALWGQYRNLEKRNAIVSSTVNQLVSANKISMVCPMRAEAVIRQQQTEITNLKAQSMAMALYKWTTQNLRTIVTRILKVWLRKFLKDEMCTPHSEQIWINSSCHMYRANVCHNWMLIARPSRRYDHTGIFDDARAPQGTTGYLICKHVPSVIEEMRQFAWSDFDECSPT